jgi:hypothetical protein
MVLGIVGLFFFTPIPGVVGLIGSHWAEWGGRRTAGVVLRWCQVALSIIAVILLLLLLFSANALAIALVVLGLVVEAVLTWAWLTSPPLRARKPVF